MTIHNCDYHNLPEIVICCEGECGHLYCSQCFLTHNPQHHTGVILNELSKNSLIEWNQFLMEKFSQIHSNLKNKGINLIYEMRLNPNYPKGLINELSNNQLVDCATKIFQQYIQTLVTNVQFISTRQHVQELIIPEFFKDLFIFFTYDAASGLYFLQEKTLNFARAKYSHKKIYDFVELVLTPKQQRFLQQKRKSIVSHVQQQTLIRIKKQNGLSSNSPTRSRIYDVQRQKESPRRNVLLSQKRMKNYNDNNIQNQSPYSSKNRTLNTNEQNRVTSAENSLSQELNKMEEQQAEKIQLKGQIINPNIQNIQKQEVMQVKEEAKPEQKQQQIRAESEQLKTEQQKQIQQVCQQKVKKTEKTEEERIQSGQNEKQLPEIKSLQQQLKQKQLSIQSLNNVISNQQQQIQCRQNQVEMLNEQIKKLLIYKQKCQFLQHQVSQLRKQLQFKEKSIGQLNKLIGNEEEQLQFRESQVETLTIQIKKLVSWKEKCEQIEAKLNAKQRQLYQRERGIKSLNNVIDNQQEQLAFRQNEVQMLTSQLKKANQSKDQLQRIRLNQLQTIQKLNKQKDQLQTSLKISQQNLKKQIQNTQLREQQGSANYDDQLLQQTIELQSQVCARDMDIKKLVIILNKIQNQIPASRRPQIIETLKSLKTVELSF